MLTLALIVAHARVLAQQVLLQLSKFKDQNPEAFCFGIFLRKEAAAGFSRPLLFM